MVFRTFQITVLISPRKCTPQRFLVTRKRRFVCHDTQSAISGKTPLFGEKRRKQGDLSISRCSKSGFNFPEEMHSPAFSTDSKSPLFGVRTRKTAFLGKYHIRGRNHSLRDFDTMSLKKRRFFPRKCTPQHRLFWST